MSKNGKKLTAIRHGEVTLLPVDAMPTSKTKKASKYIVGHSETGHHHVLESAALFEVAIDKNDLYIRLFAPGKMNHQKTINRHRDVVVKPGVYKVTRKQEYDPFQQIMRQVWD